MAKTDGKAKDPRSLVTMSVRVQRGILDKMQVISKREDRPFTRTVKRALEDYIKRNGVTA